MQVKAIGDTLRDLAAREVFVIAENGRAKLMHVEAQLMHAAGLGAQGHPCRFLACLRDGNIVGDGVAGAFIILGALDHAFAPFRPLPLCHPAADLTGRRFRRANGNSPVDLLHVARAEEIAQPGGGSRVTRDEE